MKQLSLGKKIKNLRLQKGMTQADLAGETITRNMLSQIENDAAQPSVNTILELSDKLETPAEYFFPKSAIPSPFTSSGLLKKYGGLMQREITASAFTDWSGLAFRMMKRNIYMPAPVLEKRRLFTEREDFQPPRNFLRRLWRMRKKRITSRKNFSEE